MLEVLTLAQQTVQNRSLEAVLFDLFLALFPLLLIVVILYVVVRRSTKSTRESADLQKMAIDESLALSREQVRLLRKLAGEEPLPEPPPWRAAPPTEPPRPLEP